MVQIKRAYDAPKKKDGYRVLVDRLWPRGLKKTELPLDEWAKELAPSSKLRKSFGHRPERWEDFQTRYRAELRGSDARYKLASLIKRARRSTVTLVYSAKDEEHNDAIVLKDVIDQALKRKAPVH